MIEMLLPVALGVGAVSIVIMASLY